MANNLMQSKLRNCTKGLSCGYTCIQAKKLCRVALAYATGKVISFVSSLIISVNRPEHITKLGQGAYGEVYLTATGTADKVFSTPLPQMAEDEVRIANLAGELGTGPKVLALHRNEQGLIDSYEMAFLQSYKTSKQLGKSASDLAKDTKLGPELLSQIAKLHLNNISHNDIHSGNVMISPEGKVKIVDYGLSITGPELMNKDYMLKDLWQVFERPKNPHEAGSENYRVYDFMQKTSDTEKALNQRYWNGEDFDFDKSVLELHSSYIKGLKTLGFSQ